MSATIPVIGTSVESKTAEYEMLTSEAMVFLKALDKQFESRRIDLLCERHRRQSEYDAGNLPHFPIETRHIRESAWTVAPIPDDLVDRRVEITGSPREKDGYQRPQL